MRRTRPSGFTLLELMVVVAIVGLLAALSTLRLLRDKPRADLTSTANELHALLRAARNNALQGTPTIVMVFPDQSNAVGGTGRVLIIEDPSVTFFSSGAPLNFDAFDPVTAGAGDTAILERLDFPRRVEVGPSAGMGSSAVLPAPYSRVVVSVACGFCTNTSPRRGAIRFDSRGRAWFYSGNGAPLGVWGASISLQALDLSGTGATTSGIRTLVITSSTGSVRSLIGT